MISPKCLPTSKPFVQFTAGQRSCPKIIGCAPKTLRKRCRDELDRGAAEANAAMAGYLFASAKGGNVPAQKFWLRTRAGWRERGEPADPMPGTEAESSSQVVLHLPDNGRDPKLNEMLRKAQERYYASKQRR